VTPSDQPLLQRYRGIVCDLDGVVYRGHEPVGHAVESLQKASHGGWRVVYATNNASRTPAQVAAQLSRLGLSLSPSQVVTSAQAGARRVHELAGDHARVLAVGGEGVREALREHGLVPVTSAEGVRAVLQGYGPDVCWRDLAEAAYAVQSGVPWVATNVDGTLPTERGTAPGNGTLVAAVQCASKVAPVVVGKPETPLYDLSAEVLGTGPGQTLAVGDRLDTDIVGANAAGFDALFVLTGVHGVADLARAGKAERPRYVSADLRTLHQPYVEPRATGDGTWACGAATARVDAACGELLVEGPAPVEQTLRAALAAWWEAVDAGSVRAEAADEVWQELTASLGRESERS
jgi:glycerol-1-phosphatase